MLHFGKKIRALCDKKKILTLVLSEKKILKEKKNITPPPPPFKLNGQSLRTIKKVMRFLKEYNSLRQKVVVIRYKR